MKLLASLMIEVVANMGDGSNFYLAQTWVGPTETDLVTCATMSKDLNAGFDYMVREGLNVDWQTKTATCEVYLSPDAEPASTAAPRPSRVTFTF